MKALGQSRSAYDEPIRQYDGNIIDWLPGSSETVLMAREFFPKCTGPTREWARKNGLAVDRIDVRTLKTDLVERPTRKGRLHERRSRPGPAGGDRQVVGQTLTGRPASAIARRFERMAAAASVMQKDEFVPVAVEATINSFSCTEEAQRPLRTVPNGARRQPTPETVASNPKVDIDASSGSATGRR